MAGLWPFIAFLLAPCALGLYVHAPNLTLSSSDTSSSFYHSQAIHPWPCKNGNFLRTGQGSLSGVGPKNIKSAAWTFETEMPIAGDSFYQSPVIDIHHNAIFSSTTGRMFSVAPDGKLNWAVQTRHLIADSGQLPTPVLLGDAVYTVNGQGYLVKISLATGREYWRSWYAISSGQDSWSVGLDLNSGTVFVVGFPTREDVKKCAYGGTNFYALDIEHGHMKWNYRMSECNCNIMPSTYKGSVIFSDSTGNVYALDIATGNELWKKPGNGPQTFTTGTSAVGDNGLVYVTSNNGTGHGILRVYNAETGDEQWHQAFDRETNNAPAVFRDRRGRTLVAVGVSNNAGLPAQNEEEDAKAEYRGTLYALDAKSGAKVWTWEPPIWRHQACAGSTWIRMCLPDAFSNPSVDTNSTIYIGWMGGDVFAIDGSSGHELSSYHIGSGIQGAPGIADGVLVASSCAKMVGFATPH